MSYHSLPKSPFLKANFFSKLIFWWMNGLFRDGYRRELEIGDLYEALPGDQSKLLGDQLAVEWSNECQKCREEDERKHKDGKERTRPSLSRALSKIFAGRFMLMGFLAFIEECVLRIAQPIALGYLIRYFSHKDKYEDYVGYVTASAVFLTAALFPFTHHPFFFGVCHIGMQLRVACCSLLYRKALKLSQASLRQTAIGQMVNLLSNDVNRFDTSTIFIHYLWIGPIQTVICTGILWMYYGPSCIIGLALLVLFVPLQGYLGGKFSALRAATAIRTDKRIRIMNEIISGMRVIKMYTWEFPFAGLIGDARTDEIKYIRKTSYLRAFNMALFFTSSKVIVFLTLLLFVLMGNHLTPELVFVTLALYNNVRLVMTLFFPSAVSFLAEAKVSVRRIEDFLLLEERDGEHLGNVAHNLNPKGDNGKHGVVLSNVCAKWDVGQRDYTLEDINLQVESGQVMGIVGHVGAGKGSILHAILKELPVLDGKVSIWGSVAYAAQEPWLFTGSVRDNILFGQPYDEAWYNKVVEACGLGRDLELFPFGDRTRIGDRGSTLSGGQKARVTLARAVYFNADVYLLDDPLSAVDAEVGEHLFTKCIMGILKDKVRILITHQLQFLKHVDHVVIMEDGTVTAQGTYKELEGRGINFEQLSKSVQKEKLSPSLSATSHSPRSTEVLPNIPMTSLQNIRRARSASLTSHGSSKILGRKFLPTSLRNIPQEVKSSKDQGDNDRANPTSGKYLQSVFGSFDETEEMPLNTLGDEKEPEVQPVEDQEDQEENSAQGMIPWVLYIKYFKAGSNCCTFTLLIVLNIICQILYTGSDYWLNLWTDSEELRSKNMRKHTNPEDPLYYFYNDQDFQLYGYAVVIGVLFIVSWIRTLLFFLVCMKSSVNLHKTMFNGIIHAPMQFFETNPAGRILNRFSKDMGQIDDALPPTFFDAVAIFLNVFAIILVIAIINPLLLIPVVFLFGIFFFLRKYYLNTARSVKRLEGIARSPVFSHISTSLHGLTTIRAYQAQEEFIHQFDSCQDLHTSSWYLFLATTRWFGIRLDWISVIFIGLVTFSFLIFSSSGAEVGLSVSSVLLMAGMFQWGIRQSAEVESQMVSVERVMEYAGLDSEANLESDEDKKPPSDWPHNGEISFNHTYLYFDPLHPVLKDITCTIKKSEKIGIVGRTGAGKSTLISVLFRMAEPVGDIFIDGINITRIGLHDLRSKVSIIPQEPVLFSGTLRKNLDPFGSFQDSDIWDALQEAHLAKDVKNLGLDTEVSEGGGNFSVGQRQLLCLARAILRNNKILVLDEATANVDLETDSLIQQTIRNKFRQCTVLTVAHRLNTVMDCDRIMVLEAGSIMEFDEPYKLLQNPSSLLKHLVDQTGNITATSLTDQAKKAHKDRLPPSSK